MTLSFGLCQLIVLTMLVAPLANSADNYGTVRKPQLEEIIVTAQKREQLLQEAPIAISVLSDVQLELQGIGSFGGLGEGAIPSLRVMPAGNTPSNLVVAIRGNGPGDPSEVTREGAVAVYLDGVYIARSQGLGLELADLERIEVLRGPQGTLFGRNAIGGAVSLVSKKPTGEFGVKQTLGLGRYHERRSVTRVNFPQTGGIKAKLDYLHSERDGWVNNTAPGESDYTEYDKDAGRLSLAWQVSDRLALDYSFDQSNLKTAQRYFQFYKDALGIFGEEHERMTETRLPVTPLKPTESDHRGHALTLTWEQSAQLTVKSISAYRKLEVDANNNYAGVLYFNGLNDASVIDQEQYSQELQLIGTQGRVQWVGGAYYLKEDVTKILQDSFTLDIFGIFGEPLSPISPPTTFDALGAGAILPPRIVSAKARSQAVYGQATWNPRAFKERMYITLGGRYTEDEKSATRFESALSQSNQETEHFDSSMALEYRWHDNLATYVRWGTAYKAGGVNTRSASFDAFEEEVAETFEAGLKLEFLERRARFNLALFSTDYDDLQLDFTDPANPTLVETINAAEKAEVKGVEIDLTVSPAAGFVLGAHYVRLDSKMPLQPNPLAGGTLKEFFIPLAPKHAGALTLDYRFQPRRYGELIAHMDVTSTDDYSYLPFGEQRTDAYTLWNARLTLANIKAGRGGGSFKASIWGKNLTDEEYVVFAVAVGEPAVSIGQVFGDPRTLGVDITYEF